MTQKTTIQFYHLLSTSRERAVPKLMEKALQSGQRVLMLLDSDQALKSMSEALWNANPDGFLPHGSARDAHASEQPILLSLTETKANGAQILCVLDGSTPESIGDYAKVLDVFDGTSPDATAAARQRWSAYKERGFGLQYVQQQENGGWKVEAEVKSA